VVTPDHAGRFGCAGGKDTVITLPYKKVIAPINHKSYKVSVTGLIGGHSGDDIQKGRGNANKILNRVLWTADDNFGLKLSVFDGGNLRNAIAREAFAIVLIPDLKDDEFCDYIAKMNNILKSEYKINEPDLLIECDKTDKVDFIIDSSVQEKLLNSIYACPHGVIAWSAEIPNFVETSTNLASVKTLDDTIIITTSQRSSVESAKDDICNMVASTFRLINAEIKHSDGYPGWTPNPKSEIVDITSETYRNLFNEEPKVLAIHAGLECGLIGDVYPEMDMISFGPTIKGAHSPDERLKINTVEKFWNLTIEVLRRIPENK